MIRKVRRVVLTQKELDSKEPIEIKLEVVGGLSQVDYMIEYPNDGES